MPKDYEGERRSYERGGLDRFNLCDDPFDQLRLWLDQAETAKLIEPSAMSVCTVGEGGGPSSRMVLLRKLDHGLVFFTNYESRKGREIASNPHACILFWWGDLERQVRVEGKIEQTSSVESDAYFAGRPRESQLASSASPQSQIIESREAIEAAMAEMDAGNPDNLGRPANWGGFRLIPDYFEFWQGRPARLHDRFAYRRDRSNWVIDRLAP